VSPSPPSSLTARPGLRSSSGSRAERPSLRAERQLLRDGALKVAGMDEVGRGALAGPVSVGVVVVDAATRTAPRGVADSKLLSPSARTALAPALQRWARAWAVGHASAQEIDEVGIVAALRLAGDRALAQVEQVTGPVATVLLDGSYDWLTPPADLFSVPASRRVHLRVKADRSCASVAAASVVAKVTRDALMTGLAQAYPSYGWEQNKGYGSPAHLAALAAQGPSPWHRRSWHLPGADAPAREADGR